MRRPTHRVLTSAHGWSERVAHILLYLFDLYRTAWLCHINACIVSAFLQHNHSKSVCHSVEKSYLISEEILFDTKINKLQKGSAQN